MSFLKLKLVLTGLALLACPGLRADGLDNPEVPPMPVRSASFIDPPVRVAMVDSGVNYRLQQINRSLARNEDGDLIGYDFWDMDDRPFDSHPVRGGRIQRHGTQTASLLINEAPFVELVAYRYPRPDMQRMADLIAHAKANGVRVIGLPLGGNLREQWKAFEAAAKAHPNMLFVASAGNNGRNIDEQPVYPAGLALDNLLVVTSADDFGRVADGVNWGRVSVDYMVPAENVDVLAFDGSTKRVSGSSYAVPRMVALVARYLRDKPELTTTQLLQRIRQRFANGHAPRQIAEGYLYAPRYDEKHEIQVIETVAYPSSTSQGSRVPDQLVTPLQVLVLDSQWQTDEVVRVLDEAQSILAQCQIAFAETQIQIVQAPRYLRVLTTGGARTLMDAVRLSGPQRRLTVVFASDTEMSIPFDAEAFGQGNTRHRSWLTHSVWLTVALEDRAIALAHELFHVLVNSGEHSNDPGSLMLERTTGNNTRLTKGECELARERSVRLGLAALD